MVRTSGVAPRQRLETDLAAMLPLPPIPLHLGWRNRIRLGRDYYVRMDTNDYSVDPTAIGRLVDVTADLERVRVRAEGRIVAEHPRRGRAGSRSPTQPTSRLLQRYGASFSRLQPWPPAKIPFGTHRPPGVIAGDGVVNHLV